MTRAARTGIKFFSYAIALLVGTTLVLFGIQSKDEGIVTDDSVDSILGDTADAGHINSGDSNPWGGDSSSRAPRGDDGDDGGGDDGP